MAVIGLRRPREQSVQTCPAPGAAFPVAELVPAEREFGAIVFLRHVGCPFAEKTVRSLRDLPRADSRIQLAFIGHGDDATTRAWLELIGGRGAARWIDDPQRRLYGACGLGYSGVAHFLGRASLGGAFALRREGIVNRIASGTRWQRAGAFVVGRNGLTIWNHLPATADQLPTEGEIIRVLDQQTRG